MSLRLCAAALSTRAKRREAKLLPGRCNAAVLLRSPSASENPVPHARPMPTSNRRKESQHRRSSQARADHGARGARRRSRRDQYIAENRLNRRRRASSPALRASTQLEIGPRFVKGNGAHEPGLFPTLGTPTQLRCPRRSGIRERSVADGGARCWTRQPDAMPAEVRLLSARSDRPLMIEHGDLRILFIHGRHIVGGCDST